MIPDIELRRAAPALSTSTSPRLVGMVRPTCRTPQAGGGGASDNPQRFLALLGQPPARLTAQQVAWVLNCHEDDVPRLVGAGLLKPLGNPPQNAVKHFATADILKRTNDQTWLAKMTDALYQHWREANARKSNQVNDPQKGQVVSSPAESAPAYGKRTGTSVINGSTIVARTGLRR